MEFIPSILFIESHGGRYEVKEVIQVDFVSACLCA